EWPDMNAPDATVPPAGDVETPAPAVTIDAAEERRYSVIIEGLQGIEDEPVLAKAFDEQSALREGRGEAANAAQIDRRSRADGEVLEALQLFARYDPRAHA